MATAKQDSVDRYISAQPSEVRPVLRRVRAIVRKAVPKAEEVISYQIPAYRVDGRVALFFAAWREHYSIYPVTGALIGALQLDQTGYELSHKGTIRFPLSEPVPARLIARIAKFRAEETAELARAAKARKAARTAKAKTAGKPAAKAKKTAKRQTRREKAV
jgi:uncharacterized protein YdhG (YjbR/CyaY superfamily)